MQHRRLGFNLPTDQLVLFPPGTRISVDAEGKPHAYCAAQWFGHGTVNEHHGRAIICDMDFVPAGVY